MIKYTAFNIKWDTDSELDEGEEDFDLDLPVEVTLFAKNDEDISLNGANQLSDMFGYCVISFSFKRD